MLATNLEERVDDGRNQHGLLELGVDTWRALRGGPVFRFRRERRTYALRLRRCTGMAVAHFRRGLGGWWVGKARQNPLVAPLWISLGPGQHQRRQTPGIPQP